LAAQNLIIELRACGTAGGSAGGVTARAWERGGQIVSSSSQRWALQMQGFGHDEMRGSHITLRIILGDRNSQEQGARNSEGNPRCHGEDTPPLSWLLHSSKIAQSQLSTKAGSLSQILPLTSSLSIFCILESKIFSRAELIETTAKCREFRCSWRSVGDQIRPISRELHAPCWP